LGFLFRQKRAPTDQPCRQHKTRPVKKDTNTYQRTSKTQIMSATDLRKKKNMKTRRRTEAQNSEIQDRRKYAEKR